MKWQDYVAWLLLGIGTALVVYAGLALLGSRAEAGQVVLSWDLPTQRTDGSALPVSEIAAVIANLGLCPDTTAGAQRVEGAATSMLITGLPAGHACITVQVVDTGGVHGETSAPVDKVIADALDSDLDGITDPNDNCLMDANPSQYDADADGFGNLCDGDVNQSGLTTSQDQAQCQNALNGTDPVCDLNESGTVTATDINILRALLNFPPGPSGLH